MNRIKQKLEDLSNKSSQITLFRNPDIKSLMKGIGRVPGKFDSQLLEFLKFTNGSSIFDYCFLGFKNRKLGTDIDTFVTELWPSNTLFAFQFLGFMATSTGGVFGYLINLVDEQSVHPVAYNNNEYPDRIYVIASSFKNFMETFLLDVEESLDSHPKQLLVEISKGDWPIKIEHWLKNDEKLRTMYNDGTLDNFFKKNMPLVSWY